MACIADRESAPVMARSLWHWLLKRVQQRRTPALPELDPTMLSDAMKRDLGFLDGRR